MYHTSYKFTNNVMVEIMEWLLGYLKLFLYGLHQFILTNKKYISDSLYVN